MDEMWRWAITSLLVVTLATPCCCLEQFVVVAPNLMRTDVPENIFLQAMGMKDERVAVAIKILNFRSEGTVTQHYTTLSKENNYHKLITLQIPSQNINREEKQHTYIYLEVRFVIGGSEKYYEKKPIMLSFQYGYIFIQTDKPIYRPGDKVQMRVYASSPGFKASDSKAVSLDIKNPQDVVIFHKDYREPNNGTLKSDYRIPETVTDGKWTIFARFDHLPQNNFNTTFEVKKYVLPAFNVTLTERKPYLDVDDKELFVDITARYLFKEPVYGTAYVNYGLKKDGKIMVAPKVKKVDMLEFGGTLKLTVDDIMEACRVRSSRTQQPPCSIKFWEGSYVYFKVSVLTSSGGDLVEVEKSNIKIVNSPYVLALKDMQKYFKPSHPFPITIHVTYHDGTPADKIPLIVSLHNLPLTSSSGTAAVSINMPSSDSPQTITVATNHSSLKPDRQATLNVTVNPYKVANRDSPNYLYVNARSSGKVTLRELTFEMSITSQRKSTVEGISYLILSKGKILEAKLVAVTNQRITSVTIQVTQEMIPSFRFVAFYLLEREVVSDSVKLEVSQECVSPLSISVQGSNDPFQGQAYKPGSALKLKIQGEPSATVSLVAVDQALHLLSKNRFTQSHILNEVDSRDTGCTHGSGENAMGVFSDAGLHFAMKNGPATASRQDVNCPGPARRRRSAVLMEQSQLLQQFKEKLHQRCCSDGLRPVLMPYTCQQRSEFITEGPECLQAFVKCCLVRENQVASQRTESGGLGRSGGTGSTSDSDADENDALGGQEQEEKEYDLTKIRLRDKFQETWLWRDHTIPDTAGLDGRGTLLLDPVPIPDSITKWSVLAVSSSKKSGFCVAEPWTFLSKKNFFVKLKVPLSVARNEQVEIDAVVHNYLDFDEPLDVTVVLQTTKSMCSVAFKKPHRTPIRMAPGSSAVVRYTIVPLEKGKQLIEVAAFAVDFGSDRVRKELNVVMEGVQKTEREVIQLNPSDHQGRQVARARKPNLKGVVPRSNPETKITFLGDMMADPIKKALHDEPLARLIQMPGGCVEQNLASITFPLIATVYLERTNGWETVGVDRKSEAYQYIERGYSNQLNYKNPEDGSYPPYMGRGPSTWVTAYTVKVFAIIYSLKKQLINVDEICQPVNFLLKNRQSNDGSFTEKHPVSARYMTGGLQGSDSTATLTAFVTVALAEVKKANIDCSYMVSNIETATNRAVSYLKQQLQRRPPPRPYTQAITSYALALLKDGTFDPTSRLLAASSDDGTFWNDDEDATLEATGYALLALVKMGKMTEAKKPFDYLNRNKYIFGGSFNTQNMMVILHALSEYIIARPPPVEPSLNINLQIPQRNGSPRRVGLRFDPVTNYEPRSFNMPMDTEFDVVATGNGQGTMEVVTLYNQLPEEDAKSCEAFDIEVSITKSARLPNPGTKSVFELSISVRARGPTEARSVILDVSLPTGFTAETSDLEQLLKTMEKYMDHFYFDDKLSDRGSLIIHMYMVSNRFPQILTFKLNQEFEVGLLQPSSVTVYEYYGDKGKRCTRLYSPPQDQVQLTTICRNRVCQCAQDDCCQIRPGDDDSEGKKRKDFACRTLHHVYKVKVHNVSSEFNIKYDLEITEVIKLGAERVVLPAERRFFFSHAACTKCQLHIGSVYLIMGPESDQWSQDPTTDKYSYVLGKDTWVEQWPTATECNSPDFGAKCQGITKATEDLSMEGCHAKK